MLAAIILKHFSKKYVSAFGRIKDGDPFQHFEFLMTLSLHAILCLLLSARKNPATHLSRTTLFWISRAYLLKRKTCSPRSTSTTAPLKSLSKGENCVAKKRNGHYYTSFPEKYRIDVGAPIKKLDTLWQLNSIISLLSLTACGSCPSRSPANNREKIRRFEILFRFKCIFVCAHSACLHRLLHVGAARGDSEVVPLHVVCQLVEGGGRLGVDRHGGEGHLGVLFPKLKKFKIQNLHFLRTSELE